MRMVIKSVQESPCASCKLLYGATCCAPKTGDGERLPMPYQDAAKIALWTQQPLEQAVDVKAVSASAVKKLQKQAGLEHAALLSGGVGLYLPQTEDGSCRYLGPHGCTIPNAKPTTCALYPFSFSRGHWQIGQLVREPGYCFGQDIAKDVDDALTLFGTSIADLNRLGERWQRGLKMHAVNMIAAGLIQRSE